MTEPWPAEFDAALVASVRRAGYSSPHEVLLTVPKGYQDYSKETLPAEFAQRIGQKINLRLIVMTPPKVEASDKPCFKFEVRDMAGGSHRMMVFGALRWSPWKAVNVGDIVNVQVKVVASGDRTFINAPELIPAGDWGRVVPVYASVAGRISGDKLGRAVDLALRQPNAIEDALLAIRQVYHGLDEDAIRARIGLKWSLRQLLLSLHSPRSMAAASGALQAVRRVAVDMIQFGADHSTQPPFVARSLIRLNPEDMNALAARLPFTLTRGERSQQSALQSIMAALAEPYPMSALLSADVGIGKSVLYVLPAVAARAQGKQVAILIPNGLLVEQVAGDIRQWFPEVPVVTVTGGRAPVIDPSLNPILIGTTALITLARSSRWVPDLLLIDESQKLSVAQKEALLGPHSNCLEGTATALPITLARVLYAHKQLIQVSKRHAVQTLHTEVVDASQKQSMMRQLRAVLEGGGRAAIIYPRVGGGDSEAPSNSVEAAGAAWEKRFPGRVVTLHGKMKDPDKLAAMDAIKAGDKSLLIGSSIIEIGISIRDLRFLAIVEADRYGVATLHQMRGRLVRHGGEGWCYLYLPSPVEEDTMQRLKLLELTTDGFELAERDMQARGFGSLGGEGDDQSGASLTLFRGLRLMPEDFPVSRSAARAA